eukprot:c17873_g1_i2.p1 GENE.c17873_g1_i2~~c17873_g1_i2.p1  ORF type:complete len:319 (-),score=140.93 c17873_g1_i2:128-1084(-)
MGRKIKKNIRKEKKEKTKKNRNKIMGGNRTVRQQEKNERDAAKREKDRIEAMKKKEDKLWEDDDKSIKKKEQRKAADEEKRIAEEKRRKELKELEQREQEELSKLKKDKSSVPKLTRLQIEQQIQKRKELELLEKKREEQQEDLLQENPNIIFAKADIVAQSVEEALSSLSVNNSNAERHPEKRHKAAWNEYYEKNLPIIKQEKPGLRISQYRELLWKDWQKSPENPFNQETVAYNQPKSPAQQPSSILQSIDLSSFPSFGTRELEEITKKDLVTIIQKFAPEEFLIQHGLGGLVHNIVKKKSQKDLVLVYQELAKLM